jgi:hypothetical protein
MIHTKKRTPRVDITPVLRDDRDVTDQIRHDGDSVKTHEDDNADKTEKNGGADSTITYDHNGHPILLPDPDTTKKDDDADKSGIEKFPEPTIKE